MVRFGVTLIGHYCTQAEENARLFLAARDGDIDAVDQLLHRVDVNSTDEVGVSW